MMNWNRLKLFDRSVIIFFLSLNIVVLLFRNNTANWQFHFIKHTFIAGLIWLIIPVLDKQTHPAWQLIRHWYLIAIFPFIYWNIGHFIHLIFPGEFDSAIITLEKGTFGTLPNIWVQQYVTPLLTEFMQISYAVYWFTIPVGAALFYFNPNRKAYEYLLFYVSCTFFISYAFFIMIPVTGPRFTLVDQIQVPYQGIVFTSPLRNFVASAGLHGGAFPSSHVAVAIMVLFFVWKYYPIIGKRYFLPAVLALSLATIYGQYHYVTDVVAGIFLGSIMGWVGIKHCEYALKQTQ